MTLMTRNRPTPARRDRAALTPAGATVDLGMSMVQGMHKAHDFGLPRAVSIGIDGDRVKALLPFPHMLEWAHTLLDPSTVRVQHWPTHGHVEITGRHNGCTWVLNPIPEPCTPYGRCRACLELDVTPDLDALLATGEIPAVAPR